MTFDDFEEEVCNFEDGCSGWERFLPICKDYAYQLYDENQALQEHVKDLESQLSSNPLQLTCDGCKNCDENMWCTFFANGTTVLHNFYCLGHEPKETK